MKFQKAENFIFLQSYVTLNDEPVCKIDQNRNERSILGKQFCISFLIRRPPWFSFSCSVDTANHLIEHTDHERLTAEVLGWSRKYRLGTNGLSSIVPSTKSLNMEILSLDPQHALIISLENLEILFCLQMQCL